MTAQLHTLDCVHTGKELALHMIAEMSRLWWRGKLCLRGTEPWLFTTLGWNILFYIKYNLVLCANIIQIRMFKIPCFTTSKYEFKSHCNKITDTSPSLVATHFSNPLPVIRETVLLHINADMPFIQNLSIKIWKMNCNSFCLRYFTANKLENVELMSSYKLSLSIRKSS